MQDDLPTLCQRSDKRGRIDGLVFWYSCARHADLGQQPLAEQPSMLTGFAIACFSVSAAESELPTLCQRSDKHGQNYLRLQDAKLLNRQTGSG